MKVCLGSVGAGASAGAATTTSPPRPRRKFARPYFPCAPDVPRAPLGVVLRNSSVSSSSNVILIPEPRRFATMADMRRDGHHANTTSRCTRGKQVLYGMKRSLSPNRPAWALGPPPGLLLPAHVCKATLSRRILPAKLRQSPLPFASGRGSRSLARASSRMPLTIQVTRARICNGFSSAGIRHCQPLRQCPGRGALHSEITVGGYTSPNYHIARL